MFTVGTANPASLHVYYCQVAGNPGYARNVEEYADKHTVIGPTSILSRITCRRLVTEGCEFMPIIGAARLVVGIPQLLKWN